MQPGNDNEYIIRQMEKKDIEQVERIEKEIFSIPWSAHSFEDAAMTKENIYLVCECNGVIAGYCGLWTVLGEGNITNMAVDKEYRKKGIGEALMKEMEKEAGKRMLIYFSGSKTE